MFPIDKIRTGSMPPVHISPHGAIRIMLIEQVVNTVLIYHSIGIVHPTVSRSEVINRTKCFAIGSIEFIRKLHLFPADSRIRDKLKVERKMFVLKSGKINRYEIVYFIDSKTYIHIAHHVIIGYHIQLRFGRNLFYRKK